MSGTSVINVRFHRMPDLLANPKFVYVGRACYGWRRSDWANPYSRKTPAENVADFLAYIDRNPQLKARIGELTGKILGCWCLDWNGLILPHRPCHAVGLAKMADALAKAEGGPNT